MEHRTHSRWPKFALIGASLGVLTLIVASVGLASNAAHAGADVTWWRLALRIAFSVACLGVGALSLAGRVADLRARLLSALFLLMAFEFAMPETTPDGSFLAIAAGFAYYLFTGAELAVELHLASVIPRATGPRTAWVRVVYSVGAVVAVAGSVTFAHELLGRQIFPWSVAQFDDVIHEFLLPAWAVALVLLLGGSAARWPERVGRLQAGLVLLGVLPWAAYVIVSWALGYPGRNELTLWDELVPLFLVSYPATVFVAIFRYRFLDLELIVRRSLIYTVLTGTVILLFYATLGVGTALLAFVIDAEVQSVWIIGALTVALGLAFSPLLRSTQAAIDRRFFPERAMMREHLTALAVELPVLGDPDRMARRLVEELQRIFVVDSASLYVTEPSVQRLRCLASVGRATDRLPATLPADDSAIERLTRWARPVSLGQIAGYSPIVAERLRAAAPRLVVPLCFEGRLIGLLLLGDKPTTQRFTLEERELLALVAHLGAAVFDNARLAHVATHEELTGLLRREAILAMMGREIERAQRYGRPLTIVLADVDHFKAVNDNFGHPTGDRVLRRVAGELSDRLRQSDGIGRYGGEEFLCVFPETDGSAGGRLAEKLRRAVETVSIHSDDGTPIDVRVSLGIAELAEIPAGPEAAQRLIAAADRALYRAKAGGRNRIERHRRELAGSA